MVWGNIIVTLVRGQGAIALSSCEGETYGIASGFSEAIGIRTALEFLGRGQLSIRIRPDASAALAVTQRQAREQGGSDASRRKLCGRSKQFGSRFVRC